MPHHIDLSSKFLGSLVGSALGDAIGELAFQTSDALGLQALIARQERLVYTDDTAMAIGLAESLVRHGRLDPQHVGNTFRENYRREPWRGYAPGPPTIFATVEKQGLPYTEVARQLFDGTGSFGNGAAMRIAPVGTFFYDAPDLYDQARVSASVTHAHPIGMDGAALLAWAIAWAVRMDPQAPFPEAQFCQGLVDLARTSALEHKMQRLTTALVQKVPPQRIAWKWRLGNGVAVHESLPFALYAFVRHPRSFADCLFCAALHGADRDTLGAMACAVSGAYLGVEAIPPAWREKLENRPYIEELALRLAEIKAADDHTDQS